MLRTCIAVVAAGAMAGCVAPPPSGPMHVECDEAVPARACADVRQGGWRHAALPRSRIVRIEVETVEGDAVVGSATSTAVLTDGTTVLLGELSWDFRVHPAAPTPSGP